MQVICRDRFEYLAAPVQRRIRSGVQDRDAGEQFSQGPRPGERLDENERARLFRAFHRIVDEEQPYTFVMVRSKVHCAWSNVKNLVYSKVTPVENSLPWWVDAR